MVPLSRPSSPLCWPFCSHHRSSSTTPARLLHLPPRRPRPPALPLRRRDGTWNWTGGRARRLSSDAEGRGRGGASTGGRRRLLLPRSELEHYAHGWQARPRAAVAVSAAAAALAAALLAGAGGLSVWTYWWRSGAGKQQVTEEVVEVAREVLALAAGTGIATSGTAAGEKEQKADGGTATHDNARAGRAPPALQQPSSSPSSSSSSSTGSGPGSDSGGGGGSSSSSLQRALCRCLSDALLQRTLVDPRTQHGAVELVLKVLEQPLTAQAARSLAHGVLDAAQSTEQVTELFVRVGGKEGTKDAVVTVFTNLFGDPDAHCVGAEWVRRVLSSDPVHNTCGGTVLEQMVRLLIVAAPSSPTAQPGGPRHRARRY
jgi:hypothetical protein